ncbi:MAG: hypothetical protein ACTHMW_05300 [Actinomycetes bacterium]
MGLPYASTLLQLDMVEAGIEVQRKQAVETIRSSLRRDGRDDVNARVSGDHAIRLSKLGELRWVEIVLYNDGAFELRDSDCYSMMYFEYETAEQPQAVDLLVQLAVRRLDGDVEPRSPSFLFRRKREKIVIHQGERYWLARSERGRA